jgi:hypothetical protein
MEMEIRTEFPPFQASAMFIFVMAIGAASVRLSKRDILGRGHIKSPTKVYLSISVLPLAGCQTLLPCTNQESPIPGEKLV